MHTSPVAFESSQGPTHGLITCKERISRIQAIGVIAYTQSVTLEPLHIFSDISQSNHQILTLLTSYRTLSPSRARTTMRPVPSSQWSILRSFGHLDANVAATSSFLRILLRSDGVTGRRVRSDGADGIVVPGNPDDELCVGAARADGATS